MKTYDKIMIYQLIDEKEPELPFEYDEFKPLYHK